MGIATPSSLPSILSHHNSNSMSQDYHHHQQQGIFNFPNGFDRSATVTQDHHNPPQQAQHVAQHQIRRDKVRVHQGFDPPQQPSLVPHPIEEDQSGGGGLNPVYETAGMLSEMFNFAPNAAELLEQQQQQQQQSMTTTFRPSTRAVSSGGSDWYGNRQGMLTALGPLGDSNKNHHHHNRDSSSSSSTMVHHHHHNNHHHHHHQMPNINADSAAAMHLFLMNPQPTRSPSPPQPPPSSTLHMFPPPPGGSFGNFTWTQEGGTTTNTVVEGQGLSLSLSSSLEAAKAEELRMGDSAFLYYNNQASGGGGASSSAQFPYNKSLSGQPVHIQGGIGIAQNHAGFGASASTSASLGVVNVLRNSKYVKPAQELLEEFCSVGRGQFKKNKFGRQLSNPSSNPAGGNGGSSSSSKDVPPLSAADRIEHQRRKVKLLTMLDEVDRRYKHYCEQMHMVVSSFDLVMGFGGAVPYTALAQKAMSRHFRCLKDAIMTQLKHSCELLGEKDGAGNSGLTKGETPRLKLLEQSLRQQRAFHQMGMMEQEAWRPQRGLPERSVNILRAWLFEHFLHPYPSDADKHLLARQTGLSRNQVSNWFINARVRLWKPMVEDMYQQELKEADQGGAEERERNQSSSNSGHQQATAQTPTPSTTATSSTPPPPTTTMPTPKRSDFNASESDPSIPPTNNNNNNNNSTTATTTASASEVAPPSELPRSLVTDDTCRHGSLVTTTDYGTASSDIGSSTLIRFGTTTGDVSLTLGLRHAGNMPDKTPFSLRDFGAI